MTKKRVRQKKLVARPGRKISHHAWTPEEDEWLTENGLRFPVPVVIRMMSDEFGVTRTYQAVAGRKYELGLYDRFHEWMTGNDVAHVLGISGTSVRRLMNIGLLKYGHSGRGNSGWRYITEADLEAFVRSEHLRLIPERMPRGKYRTIVELALRTNRYMKIGDFARAIGYKANNSIVYRLLSSGEVPGVLVGTISYGGPEWFIRLADVRAYLAKRDGLAA